MRKPPILPVLILVLAGIGWGTYWLTGATGMEKALAGWVETRRAEGWEADYARLDTRGFPNRFDTTIEELELADPDTRVAWSAPVFQMLSLSYKPHHVIAVWPGEQVFSTPVQSIAIAADKMIGSVVVAPEAALPLDNATIELTAAGFSSTKGWASRLDHGQLSIRTSPEAVAPSIYDLYFAATGLAPGADFMALLKDIAQLPEVIGEVTVEATARFDKPWDRSAIEVARPQPVRIDLGLLKARWGDLDLRAAGTLDIDTEGTPTGEIIVKATNWREMVEIARATGALPEELVGTVTKALELAATLAGDPETLDLRLGFDRGLAFLGPVPIGLAPTIRLP